MRPFILFTLITLLALSACQSSADQSAAPLPTHAPAPADTTNLEAAGQVARQFLDAWASLDLEAMYALLTFRNRELTPYDDFHALYQAAHGKLNLQGIDYTLQSLTGEDRVLVLQYTLTFHTSVLGTFSDNDRQLHLVIDPTADGWRIAWSPGDIFAEMGEGAYLLFEAQVPGRANIYDRDGEALADQNGRVVRVLVDNGRIPERDACYTILAETLRKPRQSIIDLFEVYSGADWFVDAGLLEAADFIETNDRIKSLCGATFRQQPTRRYTDGTLMPHVIGHVGYPDAGQIPALEAVGFNAETIIGKGSIEASMNTTLAGQPGGKLSLVGTDGARLRVLSEIRSRIPESIWLTIDADLQRAIVQLLADAYAINGWAEDSNGAAIAIMNVNTGEILALVSYPSYDNNIFNPFPAIGRENALNSLQALLEDEHLPQLNRVAQGTYVTGSVMKGLSAIAALESGVYNDSTRYNCVGTWAYGNDLRYDWLRSGHGIMSVQTGLTNSCNPFFYEVGFRLNARDPWLLPTFATTMGLGELTGIAVIPEVAGTIPTPDNITYFTGLPWSYAHAVNLSIGQGEVQVSPLQMLRMYAAIANGGYLLRPHLVRERGILDQRSPVSQREVMLATGIDPANLAIIQRGMCDVVASYTGTASHQFAHLLAPARCRRLRQDRHRPGPRRRQTTP